MIYRPHLGYQGFERKMQKQLFVRSGNKYRPAKGVEILDAAAFAEARKVEIEGTFMPGPEGAAEFICRQIRHLPYEAMTVIFLNGSLNTIGVERIFRGSVDTSPVFVREIAREVIERNATAIILAHNHPSGVARPSKADVRTTRIVVMAMAIFETQVLDHVIVGATDYFSFALSGIMPEPQL